jgi:threonine dehydratase
VVPLCGGNIDTTVLGRCIERGMAVDGRLVKFTVMVSDLPGGIADLTRLIADVGVSIKDMAHERAWIRGFVFHTNVSDLILVHNDVNMVLIVLVFTELPYRV